MPTDGENEKEQPKDPIKPGTAPAKPQQSGDAEKRYAKADVERIVEKRLAKERSALAAVLGVEPDELKEIRAGKKPVEKKDEVPADDPVKAPAPVVSSEQLTKMEKRLAAAEALNQKYATKERSARIRRLVEGKAEEEKASIPADVAGWAMINMPDDYEDVLDEDDEIDEDALKRIVSACKRERQAWFKPSAPGSPSNRGGNNPDPTQKLKERGALDQFKQMRRTW